MRGDDGRRMGGPVLVFVTGCTGGGMVWVWTGIAVFNGGLARDDGFEYCYSQWLHSGNL